MDSKGNATDSGSKPIDPLKRHFVPIEKKDVLGSWVFQTLDGQRYRRDRNGTIRSASPKINGKHAKRLRQAARKSKGEKVHVQEG